MCVEIEAVPYVLICPMNSSSSKEKSISLRDCSIILDRTDLTAEMHNNKSASHQTRFAKNIGKERSPSTEDSFDSDENDDYGSKKKSFNLRPRVSKNLQISSPQSMADSSFDFNFDDDDDDDVYVRKKKKKKAKKLQYVDSSDENCKVCKGTGEVICCDACPFVFHKHCLNPPLKRTPPGEFLCPYCSCEPLASKVKTILNWRWAPEETDEYRKKYFSTPPAMRKLMAPLRREYFVKFAEQSFWRCDWVTTMQLITYHPLLVRPTTMQDKYDSMEPPELDQDYEDDEEYGRLRDGIKNGLKKRYYDNGVRPSWLQIYRIFNDRKNEDGVSEYCVKWRDLSYAYATWETEEDCDLLLLPEFKRQIKIYKEFRNSFLPPERKQKNFVYKHITIPPTEPVSNFMEKFDYGQELPFVDSTKGLSLHDYQMDGLNWLRYSWEMGTSTILADEMGLGKTIQCITFLYSLYQEGHSKGPFLISAPLSTVVNWEREFEKWAPGLYVVTYTGDKDSRGVIRENEMTYKERTGRSLDSNQVRRIRSRIKFHVLLTSYEYIHVDYSCLQSIQWDVIVVDEAHRLKSGASKFFTYLSSYKTDYKLLMSGTPLQNNLTELFYLLNFLHPEMFRDLEKFLDEFSDISKENQVKKLQQLLGPHMLRRLKTDVLKALPPKSELLVRIELSSMQKRYYKYILTKNLEALNSKLGGRKATLTNVLMDLKKCCNHPYLFSSAMMTAPVVNEGQQDERYEVESLTEACGKLILLRKMLKKLKEQGHRVLLFSQMTRMLDILEDFLNGERLEYERIDGSISGSDRQDAIDRFNDVRSRSFVFLLSTRAGGLGINLSTADTVIIYDSDWNPHNDIQALSRAHRIGQKNHVMVYRFVMRNSVEQKVAEVAKKKMLLTQLVVESNRNVHGDKLSFTQTELEEIVNFGAKDLFKDDEIADKSILYTDEAIEELLDRNKETVNDEEVKENWKNEFLLSFKVAQFTTSDQVTKKRKNHTKKIVQSNLVLSNGQDSDEEEHNENFDPNWDFIATSNANKFQQELQQKDPTLHLGRGKRKSTMRLKLYDDNGQELLRAEDTDDEYSDNDSKPNPGVLYPKKSQKAKQQKLDIIKQEVGEEAKNCKRDEFEKDKRMQVKLVKLKGRELKKLVCSETATTTTTTTTSATITKQKHKKGYVAKYYNKEMLMSPFLSKILFGRAKMNRNLISRHLRMIIAEGQLYDPDDPGFVICNKVLKPVFGVERFKLDDMFKYLDQHLLDVDSSPKKAVTPKLKPSSSPHRESPRPSVATSSSSSGIKSTTLSKPMNDNNESKDKVKQVKVIDGSSSSSSSDSDSDDQTLQNLPKRRRMNVAQ